MFPCTNCGCCCKRVGIIKTFLTDDEFPFDVDENGSCKMLVNAFQNIKYSLCLNKNNKL